MLATPLAGPAGSRSREATGRRPGSGTVPRRARAGAAPVVGCIPTLTHAYGARPGPDVPVADAALTTP